ncbi:MAG: Gfo/Idh/MocA family oxidoreductase [Clostridia bacterium]|nr:Gfo/Idh/MocA family oxidoreductase [Clostridia bacterium]
MEEKRKIKIGIFGIGRGAIFINYRNDPINFEIVALCDKDEPRMLTVKQRYGLGEATKTYTDFDEFIKNPEMEAVFLHNYFHEHAIFAIKALKAGKHVFSDCAAIGTLGEGVQLCEAVEQTGKVYMFGENHGFQKAGLEFKRLYDEGEIGEIMYAEGEYNHPTTGKAPTSYRLSDGPFHWRAWLPSTYYCTHAMGPLMYVTGRKPVAVNARSVCLKGNFNAYCDDVFISFRDSGCAATLVTMDNGAEFRVFGTGCPGHSNSYRYHGHRSIYFCQCAGYV